MNGKQAKLLRKMNRTDKKSKRIFHSMDSKTKGTLRSSVNDYLISNKLSEISEDFSKISEGDVQ